jgi:hypothetical protein
LKTTERTRHEPRLRSTFKTSLTRFATAIETKTAVLATGFTHPFHYNFQASHHGINMTC